MYALALTLFGHLTGVTLYCMVVGHLPFDKTHFLEMYEAIKNDEYVSTPVPRTRRRVLTL